MAAPPQADLIDATRRTRLANERTYLAWLRSALTALAVAVGTGKIVPNVAHVTRWPFELLGAGFAALAVVFVGAGIRRFLKVEAALEAGEFSPLAGREALAVAAIAGVLALATLVLVFVQ
jgi:inner membrane protein YidH